jgi:glucose/arabinose dehydrogenase
LKIKNKLGRPIIISTAAVTGIAVAVILMSTNPIITILAPKSGPVLHDGRLSLELVAEELNFPTSMRFLDDGSILVLEKNNGQVRVVLDGKILEDSPIQLEVANGAEQGLLGIAIWDEKNDTPSVFLYLTENYEGTTRNLVYKYVYDKNEKTLGNKTLLLDLPAEPGPFHNGGKISIGPHDGYIYAVIGDVSSGGYMLDNQKGGKPPNDRSVILRVNRDTGKAVEDNPFYNYTGEMEKLRRYYAYGIRNSFGMDFDPVTGKLWITENGDDVYDEINIIQPGFNSGWHKIMGPFGRTNVTDIEFFNSTELGDKYKDNIFVGDINNGNLYFFEVNGERTGMTFHDSRLLDLVADPVEDSEASELSSLILGEGFEGITDIETGPDGLLYILTYQDGKIYRIVKGAG